MKRLLLLLVLSLWMVASWAQQSMEIIELRSTTVDRLLPVLEPLVERGGTISGMDNQLFIRASEANRREIRKVVAALDRPARQLLIRISRNRSDDGAARGAVGRATISSSDGISAQARVWDSRSVRSDNGEQSVRVIEGSAALVRMGQSIPLPMRQLVFGPGGALVSEGIVYRDLGQGFYVLPRLSGQRVTLEIRQQAEQGGVSAYQPTRTQDISTTVSGRLGEWIQLGGERSESAAQRGNGYSASTRDVRGQGSVWFRVEEVE